MKRRDLLRGAALAGAGALAGCTGNGSPGGSGDPTDTTTTTPTDTTTAPPTTAWQFDSGSDEPFAETALGDRSSLLLPEAVRPHTVLVWNDAEADREIGVSVTADAVEPWETSRSFPADGYLAVELRVPADYSIELTLDGETVGTLDVSRSDFECNAVKHYVGIGPDGAVDTRSAQTLMECLEPAIVGSDVETIESGCGSGNDATVSVDGRTVTITGKIVAPTPCYRAVLSDATWDRESETLDVVVATESEGGICVDCVGVVEYEATLEFAEASPDLAVVHEGISERRTVASSDSEE